MKRFWVILLLGLGTCTLSRAQTLLVDAYYTIFTNKETGVVTAIPLTPPVVIEIQDTAVTVYSFVIQHYSLLRLSQKDTTQGYIAIYLARDRDGTQMLVVFAGLRVNDVIVRGIRVEYRDVMWTYFIKEHLQ